MAIDDAYGLWIENAGSVNNAVDYRRMLAGITAETTGVLTAGTGLKVTEKSGTPNMSVDVALGQILVDGTESSTQGTYHVHNDATTNVVISAADATNPRYDMICVQIRDTAYSGASDDARIVVVTGTPAASPAEPTIPANSYTLARVQVDALASSIVNAKITDRRGFAHIARMPQTATVATNQSTSSASYTDLATAGPAVTVTTGTTALVIVTALCITNASGRGALMSYAVSGATTIAAGDATAAYAYSASGGDTQVNASRISMVSTLTPGSNTFTAKYKSSSSTVNFLYRDIVVIPL